jgi:hypothetical protein
MAKIKLTKTAVDAAQPQAQAVELRDTVVPGFLCKITPAGRKVFMLQYRTNTGRAPQARLGLYGELTVEQARVMAQDWLAEVRRGGDPRRCQGRGTQSAHGRRSCARSSWRTTPRSATSPARSAAIRRSSTAASSRCWAARRCRT